MAEKQKHFNVRTTLVHSLSKVLIEQLLDDLLQDRVLNDVEKDDIIEQNRTTVKMARQLIDTVRLKGDKASTRMVVHLEIRDRYLYEKLGLSSGQPVSPAAEPQTELIWSPTLIPTTDAFWREKQNDRHVYPVTKNSIRSRVALLITNITFTDESWNREGAEKDEENMERLLSALKYEVVKHRNLTGKEIEDALTEFSEHPKLTETDSVFVVIMSHGELGAVYGVDHNKQVPDKFLVDDIYNILNTEGCSVLRNKPKIIIIQACRGDDEGSVPISNAEREGGISYDSGPRRSLPAHPRKLVSDALQAEHKEKNFISLLSSTPGTKAYRDEVEGCILIQYVVKTFACKEHINELFRMVIKQFKTQPAGLEMQMAAIDRCSMGDKFYLFPGI